MTAPLGCISAPPCVYELGGRRWTTASDGFAEAISGAHASGRRPLCLCTLGGVEMYVARMSGERGSFVVKRMPGSAYRHAPGCPSHEPPVPWSDLDQLQRDGIAEDPDRGQTTLNLGFRMRRMPAHLPASYTPRSNDRTVLNGERLSLRDLLSLLWDCAELTHWHPGFAGRRRWATVRRHLLQAANRLLAGDDALQARLYVPEPFFVTERDPINARRKACWRHTSFASDQPQDLLLLIGEVKEIVPNRDGFQAVIRHVPDQAFAIDERLYRQLGRQFDQALSLWASTGDIRMVMIATFGLNAEGAPHIDALSLMAVTDQWLPVEHEFQRQLLAGLVGQRRAFVAKPSLGIGQTGQTGQIAAAVLTDSGRPEPVLFIAGPNQKPDGRFLLQAAPDAMWLWRPPMDAMPQLPPPLRPQHATHRRAAHGVNF